MLQFKLLKLLRTTGRATSPRPKRSATFKPRLEGLEERWCPANTDTLVWNPAAGSQDAAQAANWFDLTTKTQGTLAPTATNPIILDGNTANKPIEFTANGSAASLTVQNGYNNTLIIDATFTLTTNGADTVKSGSTLTLRPMSDDGGIVLGNNSGFTVAGGGTLNLVDAAGATAGVRFFQAQDGSDSGEYVNNAGSLKWTGTKVNQGANQINDFINAPVLNTGTFTLDGGTGGDSTVSPGTLSITLSDKNNTNSVSFYQTAGTCFLTNNAQLFCGSGYNQTNGVLASDASTCLLVGNTGLGKGDINIAGGKVVVDSVPNSTGTLQFSAATAEINGEIDVAGLTQQGGNSTTADLFDCRGVGTVTLQANSLLNVGMTGMFPLGTGNQWTVMKYQMGALKGNWGKTQAVGGMTVSTGASQVLVSN
jgi:hypothetical protein